MGCRLMLLFSWMTQCGPAGASFSPRWTAQPLILDL
nr:MAG TPA: hypothetical protein [Herelleviridae sp.]